MTIERLYLEIRIGERLDRVADECWELLPAKPPAGAFEAEPTFAQRLDAMLHARALVSPAEAMAAVGWVTAQRTGRGRAPRLCRAVPEIQFTAKLFEAAPRFLPGHP